MSQQQPPDARALARLAELLRGAPQPPTQSELDRGLATVRRRLSAARSQPSVRSRKVWVTALAVVCLISVLATTSWLRRSPRALPRPVAVQRIEGGQLLQGGYLSESGPQGIRLFFDEGSQCALTPGGRGRLRVDATSGVRLLLERGAASLQITPAPEPRWSIESGPFLVTVKGTDFTVGWDPTSEQFELTLRRGRVVVSGPLVGEAFVVRPGQKLSVSLPRAETVITEVRASAPLAAPTSSVAATAGAPIASSMPPLPSAVLQSGTAEAPSPASSITARQWRAALANGEWDRIVAEAERAGIEASLEAATSDDLFALADAARYRRRLELAESALRAQRRRFPSSPRAAEAVFLLGRVAELRPSGRAVALQRYDEYLARAPSGTYAAEALGRKMTLVNEGEGAVKARPIADEYLRRFPGGSYAGAARTLLSVGE